MSYTKKEAKEACVKLKDAAQMANRMLTQHGHRTTFDWDDGNWRDQTDLEKADNLWLAVRWARMLDLRATRARAFVEGYALAQGVDIDSELKPSVLAEVEGGID